MQPLQRWVPVREFETVRPRCDGSAPHDAQFCNGIQRGGLSIVWFLPMSLFCLEVLWQWCWILDYLSWIKEHALIQHNLGRLIPHMCADLTILFLQGSWLILLASFLMLWNLFEIAGFKCNFRFWVVLENF